MTAALLAAVLLAPAADKEPEVRGKPLSEWKERLKSKDAVLRADAISAIGEFGPAAVSAVPALTDLLGDQSYGARQQAAVTLGLIGPAAKAAIPALTKLTKSEHPPER